MPGPQAEVHLSRATLARHRRLRAQIEKIEGHRRRTQSVLPFGVAAVDSRLPARGLARGALHEIAGGGNGVIDGAAAALFAAP